METGERGALISNADYRTNPLPHGPPHPAFDWISIQDLQQTADHRMQETVALYDPGAQVIVFVFLLSESQSSMAVWQRRLAIPDTLRMAHVPHIQDAKARLKPSYPVFVDEWVSFLRLVAMDNVLTASRQASTQARGA